MTDLFTGYGASLDDLRGTPGFHEPWDEMFGRPSAGANEHPREMYREIHRTLSQMTQEELAQRTDALASSYLAQGVTFDFAGEERPFPLDAVPRVIPQDEWVGVEAGIKQRVKALEAFLADVYGDQRCVRDGVIPARLIATSSHFHRQAAGVHAANGVRIQVSGIDLIRDEHGEWRVLEDNVRVPSGVSYVISNRRQMAQTLPELFMQMRVRPVGDYPNRLLRALRAAAPENVDDPTVVVLTPGVYNSAYFEHTLLARLMGVELVEGRDLFCSGGKVWMRTTSGPQRVDVIYRRVDDEFLDPLVFRRDSMLGSPGLMLAARLGNVTIANGVGNGVADDKLVYTYMPDLIRYYLGEEPVIKNVDTWRLEEPDQLAEVLDRLDELVVKPVDGSGGKGLVVGSRATKQELDALRQQLLTDPRGWIAQPTVQLSTIPTLVEDGMRPRHADLRPFAVNDGDDVWVLPGGLTRVALPEGQLVVNSSQGGGSKDTWVVTAVGAPAQRTQSQSQSQGGGTQSQSQSQGSAPAPHQSASDLVDEQLGAEIDAPAPDTSAITIVKAGQVRPPAQAPDQSRYESRNRSATEQQQQSGPGAPSGGRDTPATRPRASSDDPSSRHPQSARTKGARSC